MRNKILTLVILVFVLIFSKSGLAQEEIKITLIEYNPETNFARVQIDNNLETDLHNLNFQLNTLPQTQLVSVLKAKNSIAKVLNAPEGIHTVKITSDELTVSKDLSFSASFSYEYFTLCAIAIRSVLALNTLSFMTM